jgi:hypothetical protein
MMKTLKEMLGIGIAVLGLANDSSYVKASEPQIGIRNPKDPDNVVLYAKWDSGAVVVQKSYDLRHWHEYVTLIKTGSEVKEVWPDGRTRKHEFASEEFAFSDSKGKAAFYRISK